MLQEYAQVANTTDYSMRSTAQKFGTAAIFLHWSIALGTLGLFASGWYMVRLDYYSTLYTALPIWHQSIGVCLGVLLLCQIIWRQIDVRPDQLAGQSRLKQLASKLVHWLLTALVLVLVVSGYAIGASAPLGLDFFGYIQLPNLVSLGSAQIDTIGWIHKYFAYSVVALACLHMLAALKHHWIDKDNTLRKMLGIAPHDKHKA